MIPLHKCPHFNIPSITHGWTAKDGPDFQGSPKTPAHAELAAQFSATLSLEKAAWVTQVHGGDVLHAKAGGWSGSADGLWTDKPGLGVIGRSADCPIILIAGPKTPSPNHNPQYAWGFAHASWRSTFADITGSLVRALRSAGVDSKRMQACICPSAGPCCYEVKDDVVQAAKKSYPDISEMWFKIQEGRITLDLWQANRDIMVNEGIGDSQIFTVGICTICSPDYHSFRRDGESAGRFAAIIGLPVI